MKKPIIMTEKWKFHSYKDENPSKNFFFHEPLVQKTGAGGYAQISNCYVVYLLCYIIAGHSFGALMYLKT